MYDNYIELKVEGLTRGKDLHDAFILVLRAKDEGIFFPVLLTASDYNMIAEALQQRRYTCSRLMNQLAARVGMAMLGVRLMKPHHGKTQALIDFELVNELVSITVPAAEAVVAALETHSPIWVQKATFERQARLGHSDQSMALPITAMAENLLQEALRAAVEEENFELASILRDELNKRGADEAPNNPEQTV